MSRSINIGKMKSEHSDEDIQIKLGYFNNPKNLCVFAVSDTGEPYDRMTWSPDEELKCPVVLLRSWQMTPYTRQQLLATGAFKPIGKIPQGYSDAEVWEVLPEFAQELENRYK